MNIGKQLFIHNNKEKIFTFVGYVIFIMMNYMNFCLCWNLLKSSREFLAKLINIYLVNPQLFQHVPYMFHVYFSLTLFVGLPIIFISSLVLSIFYLNKPKSNMCLYVLCMPFIFAITNATLAQIGLYFI